MKSVFRTGFAIVFAAMLALPFFSSFGVFAQSNSPLNQIFSGGNYPVDYNSPYVVGRGTKSPYSIDQCLKNKEFFFNELHNVWVDGLVRCKTNDKGVVSKATLQGVSTTPEDEQACKGFRDGEILLNGTPSESRAREWSEHCSYLGTVGGAGPIKETTPTTTPIAGSRPATGGAIPAPLSTGSTSGTSTAPVVTDTTFNPVYNGPGVVVPPTTMVAKGISTETSLIKLIVFYTNVTLPYVSVLSILAFVVAGLYYILTFANEELNAKAKTIMMYVVIGIVIIFSSFTIVNFLLGAAL